MEYVDLKNTDVSVSRFCMGGCPMGGYGWGSVREDELIDAIHQALELGVNFFDTADTYGLGQSEMTLAKGLGNRRRDVIIQSKFGVRVENGTTRHDNSPKYIREALEKTLRRLNTDYIDIYTIHYRDGVTPIEDVVAELLSLRSQGKIRFFGLSNINEENIDEIRPYKGLFVNCQDEYSLACRKNERVLEKLESELELTPMTWGSLGQGVLTGKYDRDSTFGADDRRSREIYVNFHGKKLEQNLMIVETLKRIAEDRQKSIPACAIRYILDRFPHSVVIAGVKRQSQLLSNLEAMGWHLSEDEMRELENVSSCAD